MITARKLKTQILKLEKQLYKLTKKCKHKDIEIRHVITIDGFDTITLKLCKCCGMYVD